MYCVFQLLDMSLKYLQDILVCRLKLVLTVFLDIWGEWGGSENHSQGEIKTFPISKQ